MRIVVLAAAALLAPFGLIKANSSRADEARSKFLAVKKVQPVQDGIRITLELDYEVDWKSELELVAKQMEAGLDKAEKSLPSHPESDKLGKDQLTRIIEAGRIRLAAVRKLAADGGKPAPTFDSVVFSVYDGPNRAAWLAHDQSEMAMTSWGGKLPRPERKGRVEYTIKPSRIRNVAKGETCTVTLTPWGSDANGTPIPGAVVSFNFVVP